MTAAEWEACDRPGPMLEAVRGRVGDRELRLFAHACCRSIWGFIPDGPCRDAAEACLASADGRATADALATVRKAAMAAAEAAGPHTAAAWAACESANPSAFRAACVAAEEAREQLRRHNPRAADEEAREQAGFLRDIIGNPFGDPRAPAWPTIEPPVRYETATVQEARAAFARYMNPKKYRRAVRKALAAIIDTGRVVRPGEWDQFVRHNPDCDLPNHQLEELFAFCHVHSRGLVREVVRGVNDDSLWSRIQAFLSSRAAEFPFARGQQTDGEWERTMWWCPECQLAREAWMAGRRSGS